MRLSEPIVHQFLDVDSLVAGPLAAATFDVHFRRLLQLEVTSVIGDQL